MKEITVEQERSELKKMSVIQVVEERREIKAERLAKVLFDYGVKSWQAEHMDLYQWQLAAMGASAALRVKVNAPGTEEARVLTIIMLRGLEEEAWRREPMYRSFAGCSAAIDNRTKRSVKPLTRNEDRVTVKNRRK